MGRIDDEKIQYIVSKLRELDYGMVNITVHDGEITQIDSTEKKRFQIVKRNLRK